MADPSDLIRARCAVHPQREAAARCPECRGYFCRECVTEHGDRALCASCLRRQAGGRAERRAGPLRTASRVAQLGLGLLLAWFFFFVVGEILSSLPDSFHEGSRFPGASAAP